MTVTTQRKELNREVDTSNDSWVTVLQIDLAEGKSMEVYGDIFGLKSDGSSRVRFDLEGMFYRQTGGNVTADGAAVKTSHGSLAGDVDVVANTSNQSVDVKVKGVAATSIAWEIKVDSRIKTGAVAYSGDPRMQMTIVGLTAGGFAGWAGLQDGINSVLVPTTYEVGGTLAAELWKKSATKTVLGATVTDLLSLKVVPGTGGTGQSTALFKWITRSGGTTGAQTTKSAKVSFTTGVNTGFQNRLFSGSMTELGVTFLWSRHDVSGWVNYP